MEGTPLFYVKRLGDNMVLLVVDQCKTDFCVVEFFEYADGESRPSYLWHPKELYVKLS